MTDKTANLQDVSVPLESVHEGSIERSSARDVGVLRHLVIYRCKLTDMRHDKDIHTRVWHIYTHKYTRLQTTWSRDFLLFFT